MSILKQNRIRISKDGCAISAFLMTSEILSRRIEIFVAYLSFSPTKIIKQTLLKDLILLLFSDCSFEKKEEIKVTFAKYSANRSFNLSY
jgi:hypothetical protein